MSVRRALAALTPRPVRQARRGILALAPLPGLARTTRLRAGFRETEDAPLVSVVIATYNWSSVLRYSVASALAQTYPRLEVVVVGDACTDDSEDVVASFGDPRVRWLNLPENSGSQSTPNNAGIAAARGDYVAYLGHDDLWLPSHLSLLMTAVLRSGADAGYAVAEQLGPPRQRLSRPAGRRRGGSRAAVGARPSHRARGRDRPLAGLPDDRHAARRGVRRACAPARCALRRLGSAHGLQVPVGLSPQQLRRQALRGPGAVTAAGSRANEASSRASSRRSRPRSCAPSSGRRICRSFRSRPTRSRPAGTSPSGGASAASSPELGQGESAAATPPSSGSLWSVRPGEVRQRPVASSNCHPCIEHVRMPFSTDANSGRSAFRCGQRRWIM